MVGLATVSLSRFSIHLLVPTARTTARCGKGGEKVTSRQTVNLSFSWSRTLPLLPTAPVKPTGSSSFPFLPSLFCLLQNFPKRPSAQANLHQKKRREGKGRERKRREACDWHHACILGPRQLFSFFYLLASQEQRRRGGYVVVSTHVHA